MRRNEKIQELESKGFESKLNENELRNAVVAEISSSNPGLRKLKCNVNRYHKRITIRAKHGKRKLFARCKSAIECISLFDQEIKLKIQNTEW